MYLVSRKTLNSHHSTDFDGQKPHSNAYNDFTEISLFTATAALFFPLQSLVSPCVVHNDLPVRFTVNLCYKQTPLATLQSCLCTINGSFLRRPRSTFEPVNVTSYLPGARQNPLAFPLARNLGFTGTNTQKQIVTVTIRTEL